MSPEKLETAAARPHNRRAHPRLHCNGIAEVTVLPLGKPAPGKLLDLSVSGCCISADGLIPEIENPAVEVQVRVNGTTLRVAGVVRNVRKGHRVGIQFVQVTRRKAEQINQLVAELAERTRTCAAQRQRPS